MKCDQCSQTAIFTGCCSVGVAAERGALLHVLVTKKIFLKKGKNY